MIYGDDHLLKEIELYIFSLIVVHPEAKGCIDLGSSFFATAVLAPALKLMTLMNKQKEFLFSLLQQNLCAQHISFQST